MPRDIPVGNGSLLVTFDQTYQVRDFYWPHVGQENHSPGHPFRFGVWVDGEFRWIDHPGWQRTLDYEPVLLLPGLPHRRHGGRRLGVLRAGAARDLPPTRGNGGS